MISVIKQYNGSIQFEIILSQFSGEALSPVAEEQSQAAAGSSQEQQQESGAEPGQGTTVATSRVLVLLLSFCRRNILCVSCLTSLYNSFIRSF